MATGPPPTEPGRCNDGVPLLPRRRGQLHRLFSAVRRGRGGGQVGSWVAMERNYVEWNAGRRRRGRRGRACKGVVPAGAFRITVKPVLGHEDLLFLGVVGIAQWTQLAASE